MNDSTASKYDTNGLTNIPKVSLDSIVNEISKIRDRTGKCCPYCNHKSIVKYGRYKNIQRYKCKKCSRTFNDFSFTPMHKSHYRSKWSLFIECMIAGYSLRKSSQVLKISFVSLFYWRHKVLDSLKLLTIEGFKGIVEMDDMYLAYSEKGKRHIVGRAPRKRGYKYKHMVVGKAKVCVFSAVDRKNTIISKVGCLGKIYEKRIDNIIGKSLSRDNILCTDNWKAYINYAKRKGFEHHIVNLFSISKKYNIQSVKSYNSKFEIWLKKFSGVASKYLNNYAAWFKYVTRIGFKITFNNIRNMLIMSCINKIYETCDSIRLKEFSI
ncbi:IS1595 family transposase [Clostridium neuense]|uniref:IS1595 family transposase n=1 Tax=Clostridium neuense TaxID=1728934 RepID=A0ABW8T9B6_9CLOT